MVNPVYANVSDYRDWVEDETADISTRTLKAASRVVDQMLLGAVYTIDQATQLATDPAIRDAIRDATCAQAAFMDDAGDTSGDGPADQVDSASIGSVSFSGLRRTTAGITTTGAAVSAAASAELAGAGLRPVVFVHG